MRFQQLDNGTQQVSRSNQDTQYQNPADERMPEIVISVTHTILHVINCLSWRVARRDSDLPSWPLQLLFPGRPVRMELS